MNGTVKNDVSSGYPWGTLWKNEKTKKDKGTEKKTRKDRNIPFNGEILSRKERDSTDEVIEGLRELVAQLESERDSLRKERNALEKEKYELSEKLAQVEDEPENERLKELEYRVKMLEKMMTDSLLDKGELFNHNAT